MRIGTEFSLPLAPSEAWPLLLDAPTVAACVPGATLLEDLGGNRYRGRASVKLGPVQLEFAGEIAIVEADASDCTATVRARGTDHKGRGGAAADVQFRLSGAGNVSLLETAGGSRARDAGGHHQLKADKKLEVQGAQACRSQIRHRGILTTLKPERVLPSS